MLDVLIMAYHLKNKPEKWISPARILGMDHGTKTLGLAISNSDQTIVTPMDTIHRKKWAQDKDILNKIIVENDVQAIVVGYPLNMDGSKGARCQSVKDFVTLMEQAWPDMLFFFYDERLSTQTVDKFLDNDMSKTRIKRKEFKDSLAAKVILDEALEWARNNNFKH
jgi:putative Holliday junction resolvase